MNKSPPHSTWTIKELSTCILCNRANRYPISSQLFASASYLGNGLLWYLLMLGLLITQGMQAVPAVLSMIITGVAATVIYRFLKQSTMRPRPCAISDELIRTVEPLDRFSFPSGHTLHAVAFTLIACSWYPSLSWFLMPFTMIVAISRLVLGLHYPSDVLAGAALGAIGASFTLLICHPLQMGTY